MGAWIEICVGTGQRQGRAVAPLVGAWIEIIKTGSVTDDMLVAPLVGAWIEIKKKYTMWVKQGRRSPRGSVD